MISKEKILEQIAIFKKQQVDFASALIKEFGGLEPAMTVLVYLEASEEFKIVNIQIPGELMETEVGKDIFAILAPKLLDSIDKAGKLPICMSWSTEAWLRKTPEGVTELPEDWKSLPKEEALITYFESEYEASIDCLTIKREGKRATPDGDLIDNIELSPNADFSPSSTDDVKTLEGRFTHLFSSFKNNKKKKGENK